MLASVVAAANAGGACGGGLARGSAFCDGKQTVKYHLLGSMLLNELKRHVAAQERERDELRARIGTLEARLAALESRASR